MVPKAPCVKLIPPMSSVAIGGVAESIVTSVGGPAITLAPNGAGTATSFAGSLYTVIASPTR